MDNSGSSITITDEQVFPGSPGTRVEIPVDSAPDDNRNAGHIDRSPQTGDAETPERPARPPLLICDRLIEQPVYCADREEDPVADEPSAPVVTSRFAPRSTPVVLPTSASDLVTIAPSGTVIAAEPGNVGVVGLPTNFVAAASPQTVEAELFGTPVSARFSPTGYDFHYGDGTFLSSETGGQTWADLGQAQFTLTSTSHTYGARGTFLSRVDVRYAAEVSFGEEWYPVSGEVTSVGAEQEVRIFEARTALVSETCHENPAAPGCE